MKYSILRATAVGVVATSCSKNSRAEYPGILLKLSARDIATQLDVDSNDNLLVHVFQSNGRPFIGVTVTIFVSSSGGNPVEFQVVSDSNGLAQFKGPSNNLTLTAQTRITAMVLQFLNAGVPYVRTIHLQVGSSAFCNTSGSSSTHNPPATQARCSDAPTTCTNSRIGWSSSACLGASG